MFHVLVLLFLMFGEISVCQEELSTDDECKSLMPSLDSILDGTKVQKINFKYNRVVNSSFCVDTVDFILKDMHPPNQNISEASDQKSLEVTGIVHMSKNAADRKHEMKFCAFFLADMVKEEGLNFYEKNKTLMECLSTELCRELGSTILGNSNENPSRFKTILANYSSFKNLIDRELSCDTDDNSFSKISSSIVRKINVDIDSKINAKIPLVGFETINSSAAYGTFAFLEHFTKVNEAMTIVASSDLTTLNISFNYVIPKGLVSYFNFIEDKKTDSSELCAKVQDIKILLTLSMIFNNGMCGTIISEHEFFDDNDDFKIESCESGSTQEAEKIQEVFGRFVLPIILTVIKTRSLKEVHQILNCRNFMHA